MSSPVTEIPPISTSRSLAETPLFFESAGRPLYGVFHAARKERPGAPVAVFCHSVGVEQMTCYRNDVLAARAVAALGVASFRWHARGHGDSSGDFADVTLDGMVDDARAAAAEAKRRSGADRVVWVGTRLGGMVAAEAARLDGAAGLALWEPVGKPADSFRAMLRGILFSSVAHGEKPKETVGDMLAAVERDGRVDVQGYYLHRTLVHSFAGRDLAGALDGWGGPTLLVQIQRRPGLAPAYAAVIEALEGRGAAVTTALVHDEPGWYFMSNPAWQNDEVVRRTAEWLDALA